MSTKNRQLSSQENHSLESTRDLTLQLKRGAIAVGVQLAVLMVVVTAACDTDATAGEGQVGQPCVTHTSCLPELECVDSLCQPDGWYPIDSDSTGANTPTNLTVTEEISSTGDGTKSATTTPTATSSTPTHEGSTDDEGSTTGLPTTSSADTSETTSSSDSVHELCAGLSSDYLKPNPYNESNSAIVAAGQVLYGNNNCGACHGANAQGGFAVSLTAPHAAMLPDCQYRLLITEGLMPKGMPASSMPPDSQFKIITYLRSLQP